MAKGYTVQIDTRGLKEAILAMGQIEPNIKQVMSSGADKLGVSALRYVKEETPKDSGKLRNSTAKRKKGAYGFEIYQTAKSDGRNHSNPIFYGRAVRMGSRGGYNIVPFSRQALYWGKKKGSRGLTRPIPFVGQVPQINFFFATRQHPGIQKPYNYVGEALNKLNPEILAFANRIRAAVSQGQFKRFRTRSI